MKQEVTGKAFEYSCLMALYTELEKRTSITIEKNVNFDNVQKAYNELSLSEQQSYTIAADKAAKIIIPMEPNLDFPDSNDNLILGIQPDKQGQFGDVRDVVCLRNKKGWAIGFSCKHNHDAVKHSRLSRTIDFGKEWTGHPVSDNYKTTINPIFDELDELRNKKARWAGIEKKDERFYKTILDAFLTELRTLYSKYQSDVPEKLLTYLLGRFDFYKIVAQTNNKTTEVKPFNMYGTLGISTSQKKPLYKIGLLKMPTKILEMNFKTNSLNTIIINFDNGWCLSFRIHNASEWVEPSLKFDIQLIGVPANMSTRIEPW